MKHFFFLLLATTSPILHAQNGIIKGQTTDNQTKKPAIFVSVALLAPSDSSVVQGAVTDTLGKFIIQNLADGVYLVSVSSVEYEKQILGPITVAGSEQNIGEISLVPAAKQLAEVKVTASKPVFEQRFGNVIVNVDSKVFKTAVNALEVMRRSPGLIIDSRGNITFRGSSPKILVDGKDLRMSPEQEKNYLRTLTPDQIESIELMPNPPAKYEAAFATVINIKLKRDQTLGTRGSAYVAHNQHRFGNSDLGGNLTYKTQKMAYSLIMGVARSNWYQELSDKRTMTREGGQDVFETFGYIRTPDRSLNFTAGAEYTINPKSTIDFKLTGSTTKNDNTTVSETKSSFLGIEQPFLRSNNTMPERNSNITGLLGYRYKKDSREFIAEIAAADNKRSGSMDLVSEYLKNGQAVRGISRQRNTQNANSNFKTLNVSFSEVVFKKWQFETGFKINFVENFAKIDFDTLLRANATRDTPLTNSDFGYDRSRSNEFRFTENINMVFAQMSGQMKKLSLVAGLRAENTVTRGESVTSQSLVNRNYWNLLPTLTFQYQINDHSNWVWASSRKISRPGVWQLNPFPFYLDPVTIAKGDPFLFPQIRTASELSYTYKKLMVIGGYNHYKNQTSQLPLYNATQRLTTWQQINTVGQRFFFDVSYAKDITKKWTFQTYFSSAYSGETLTQNNTSTNRSGLTASVWANNTFTLPKSYTLELSGFYNVPNRAGFFQSRSVGAINLGVQKSVGPWNFQLNANDIFWMSNFRAKVQVAGTDLTFFNRQPQRTVSARATYNFGKSKYQAQGRKSGVSEDAQRIRK